VGGAATGGAPVDAGPDSVGGATSSSATTGTGGSIVQDGGIASENLPRADPASVSASDQAALVSGNDAFAFDLYKQLASAPSAAAKNVFFSPLSISMVLGMASAGAGGATQTEMAKALHFTLPQSALQAAFNWLDLSLLERAQAASMMGTVMPAPTLSLANALWGQQTFAWQTPFLDVLATDYGTGVNLGDFVSNPDAIRTNVNDWVSQQTAQHIQNLLPPGSVSSQSRLLLVNAIDLAFSWQIPFNANHSGLQSFTPDGAQPLQINTMNEVENFVYAEDAVAQAVWLPLVGGQITVEIYLPKTGGLASLEPVLATEVAALRAARAPAWVGVQVPSFSYTTPTIPLSPALTALGMTTAFGPGADFSGMTTTQPLHLDEVFHEAMLSLNEAGVHAAAATAANFGACGAASPQFLVDVDHSFIVGIRDEVTGSLLFLGRIVNPNEQGAVSPVPHQSPC
jgi:serpin B